MNPLPPRARSLLARRALALALAALPTAPLAAQTVLHTLTGTVPDEGFGSAVSSAGDMDGDGFPDLLVGATDDDTAGQDAGAVFAYSGLTAAPLLDWHGEAAGDGLGDAVASAGDVNGDGRADLLAGEYRHDGVGANSGRALVWSGADGSVLLVIDGSGTDDEFGIGVAGIGDVDGDGVPDVAVGAHHDDDNGFNSGSVRLVSGADGSQIRLILGDEANDDLGHVLCGCGDVDGDGVPDVLIGLHDNPEPGQARLYSGADGSLIFEFMGNSNNDFYGHAVACAGDADLDGIPDLLIGASRDDAGGMNAGRAWLRKGSNGAVLFDWKGDSPNDALGAGVSSAGDWNGDGVPDALIAMPGDDPNGPGSGAARFVSGVDGAILQTLDGTSPGQRVDVVVADAADVNGDTRPDVLIGFPYHDLAATDAGLALVVSGALPTWTSLGSGLAGASGTPALAGQGLLAAGTPGALRLHGAAPLAPAMLFVSIGSLPVPFKGGTLAAFPSIAQLPLATDAGGAILLPWLGWPTGIPAALELVFQEAVADAGAVHGVALSNAVAGTTK